jgi:hypothetical protein
MPQQPTPSRVAALLGDVVASRKHPDRAGLQEILFEAFAKTNDRVKAIQPLSMTIGDEFQALYKRVADALTATLMVRLHTTGRAELRFGIGWGEVVAYDPNRAPFGQDGPAWWSAREAIARAATVASQRESPRSLRTAFIDASRLGTLWESLNESGFQLTDSALPTTDETSALHEVINAFLICRDELLSRLDQRDASLMLALLVGEKLSEVAIHEGVTPSALSQRATRKGLYSLLAANKQVWRASV